MPLSPSISSLKTSQTVAYTARPKLSLRPEAYRVPVPKHTEPIMIFVLYPAISGRTGSTLVDVWESWKPIHECHPGIHLRAASQCSAAIHGLRVPMRYDSKHIFLETEGKHQRSVHEAWSPLRSGSDRRRDNTHVDDRLRNLIKLSIDKWGNCKSHLNTRPLNPPQGDFRTNQDIKVPLREYALS